MLEEGADEATVRDSIVNMPNYFADFDTTVNFIDQATFNKEHSSMPHGGLWIRSGSTGADNTQTMEFSLALGSNPEFTKASVLVAYARAVHRLARLNDIWRKNCV